jgi:hypothetical protein
MARQTSSAIGAKERVWRAPEARACQCAARAGHPAGLPLPVCQPFERSSHGLLVSNRSTGPIWPAAQLEVRHGAKITSVPVVRRRVEGEASFAPCDQSLFGEDRPWLHPVPNARALLPDRGIRSVPDHPLAEGSRATPQPSDPPAPTVRRDRAACAEMGASMGEGFGGGDYYFAQGVMVVQQEH